MFGLDEHIAALGSGDALAVVAVVALLLGLRHATDPDHLAAVSTLIASDPARGARRAGALGLAWGIGHAFTLFALGLPILLLDAYLPAPAQKAAEVVVGLLIIGLAVRLLWRWRQGAFHAHAHRHGGVEHRHLHAHEHDAPRSHPHPHRHEHQPAARLGRTPLQAGGIGLVHGAGGSAGVGVLLLAAIPDTALGVTALAVFALGTALSMALSSTGLGFLITCGPVLRRFAALAPGLGVASLAFGAWYALGAVGAVPYLL